MEGTERPHLVVWGRLQPRSHCCWRLPQALCWDALCNGVCPAAALTPEAVVLEMGFVAELDCDPGSSLWSLSDLPSSPASPLMFL